MVKGKIAASVLLDEDRHEEMIVEAKRRGMSLSAFLRNCAYEKLDTVKKEAEAAARVRELRS